jgi:hypothetical protein
MKKDQFRTPLFQSGAVLIAAIFLFSLVPSSGASHAVGAVSSIFWGIIYAIVFPIALVLALVFSLAVLTAIVLGTVALYSPTQASEMYKGLKEKLAIYREEASIWAKAKTSQWCCQGTSAEENARFKEDLAVLHRKNSQLETELIALRAANEQLQKKIKECPTCNSPSEM